MNKTLSNIGIKITTMAGRTGLKIQEKSPEILLTMGIVGFVGTVVLACKATLKCEEVFDQREAMLNKIEETKEMIKEQQEDGEEHLNLYSPEDEARDLRLVAVKTGIGVAKMYAPAIGLGVLSLTCIITSRNIAHRRYLGVVAAYNGLSEVMELMKRRIIEEEGEDKYRHYRYGTELKTIINEEVDENGKKSKSKEIVEEINKNLPNDTAVFFDESNPNWDPNPHFSMMFLRSQQNWANDLFRTRGHVFLNEVYDRLGFDHTPQGAVLGWVKGEGDDYIDFGLYNENNPGARRFVNGKDNIILLDFNHDGPILNKI